MDLDDPLVLGGHRIHLQDLRGKGKALPRDPRSPKPLRDRKRVLISRCLQDGARWRRKDTAPAGSHELTGLYICLARTFLWKANRNVYRDEGARRGRPHFLRRLPDDLAQGLRSRSGERVPRLRRGRAGGAQGQPNLGKLGKKGWRKCRDYGTFKNPHNNIEVLRFVANPEDPPCGRGVYRNISWHARYFNGSWKRGVKASPGHFLAPQLRI